MKKIVLAGFTLFISILLTAQQKKIAVRIEQGSESILVGNQEITLSKAPFKMVVSLHHLDGVYLFASFSDSIYRLQAEEAVPDFKNLPYLAIAEASFNEDKELIINTDGWAFWFYDPELDWHRFDKDILVTKDSVVGTKTINQFYIPDTKSAIPVSDNTKPLYLFFLAIDKSSKDGVPKKELVRLKMKIYFE
ncbi:MAG: hypothetical protein JNM19_11485 [Chitinophagaceae bacterium]|nr:hypothetical protein [Chitinophagaceae bacterium]